MSAEVVCRCCGAEVSRKTARAERWLRSPEGWTCPCHPPLAAIDWSFAGQLAAEASDELTKAVAKLFTRDAAALEYVDEAAAVLVELQEIMAALRASRAA